MAKASTAQPTKEEKAALKASQKAAAKAQRSQMWQAFNMQRKQDKLLIPLMLAAVIGFSIIGYAIGLLLSAQWFLLPLGIMIGILAAMMIFSRRIQTSVYDKAEGQPGAAAWAIDQLRGTWRITPTVAATTNLDAIHRIIGKPGVVLVGEGEAHRVAGLMKQEKKKVARVIGDTPIYEVHMGDEEGQVPLRQLNKHIRKLPNNIDAKRVDELDVRLTALGAKQGAMKGVPQGPLPKKARSAGMGRAARRRSEKAQRGRG